ncbi:MAG: MFS transporter, partial [Williamsia herbipolensis]|nr:MFS transporter [Williamsia herbipolensis]
SESVSAILAVYLTTVIGLGPLGYGFVDGVYQGVSAVVRIAGGWAADRRDRPKWIAAAGYGLSALSRVALIAVHSFAAVTAVIGVDRVGKGLRTAPRDAMIAASSEPGRMGRAFGVHRSLDTLGAVIGPFTAFAILAAAPGDFRTVFVFSLAAAAVGLAILVILVPDVRPRRDQPADVLPAAPRFALVRVRRLRVVVMVTALLGMCTVGDGFLYLAMQQRDDLALKYFPLLYVGTNVAYMALAVPLGRVADRVGSGTVFLGGHVALLAAYAVAGGPFGGGAVTIIALVLLGSYYAATDGQLAAMASRLFGAGSRASAIAVVQTAQAVARFVSSLAFGAVWSWTGEGVALVVFGAMLVAALPIAWQLLRVGRADVR